MAAVAAAAELRDAIEHRGIFRCVPGARLPAKAGAPYAWQFYLRRVLLDARLARTAGELLWARIADPAVQLAACEAAGVPPAKRWRFSCPGDSIPAMLAVDRKRNGAEKERLERLKAWSSILSSIAVPIVLGVVGFVVQARLAEQGLKKDFVAIAVDLLREDPKKQDKALRKWAVDVLASQSPVELSPEAKLRLEDNPITKLSAKDRAIFECAATTGGDPMAMAGCAARALRQP